MLVATIATTRPGRQVNQRTALAEEFKLLIIAYISFILECKYKITRLTQQNSEGLSLYFFVLFVCECVLDNCHRDSGARSDYLN
jgi:hypothetical protein